MTKFILTNVRQLGKTKNLVCSTTQEIVMQHNPILIYSLVVMKEQVDQACEN